jgi:hypothetical protein
LISETNPFFARALDYMQEQDKQPPFSENPREKTHTYDELFTKVEPKNERQRNTERSKDGWETRLIKTWPVFLNKRILITTTFRFPLLMSLW